jgi:hypothetical protein
VGTVVESGLLDGADEPFSIGGHAG